MLEKSNISQHQTNANVAIAENSMPQIADNQSVEQTNNLISIQPKLTIGSPNDPYEQEADAVANQIMRMPIEPFKLKNDKFGIQKKSINAEKEEEKIQRKPFQIPIIQKTGENGNKIASESLSNQINTKRGSGNNLNESTKSFMESRFNTDFSKVNIHTDTDAVQMSQSINAQAFTVGSDIFFNQGKFNPEADSGKQLLAHELTHTIQQEKGIQRQLLPSNTKSFGLNFTDELLSLPDEIGPIQDVENEDELFQKDEKGESEGGSTSNLTIQKSPISIQKEDAPAVAAPVRKDLVFIMGKSGGFYVAAKKFFQQHHAEAEIVEFKDRSLAGVFAELRTKVSDANPAGNIYIVSHANQDGTLSFPLKSKDKDKITTFGELKVALSNEATLFELNGGVDDQTFVHIKGCNIGRNTDMLNVLDEAFGGKDKVDAPTHKQGYEYHSRSKKSEIGPDGEVIVYKDNFVSSEFFNTLIVEYQGNPEKDNETLIADFKEKYSQLSYEDHEWEMMVLGSKKYNAKIDKEAKVKKAAIDTETKEKKKDIEKADKEAIKAIDEEAKAAKIEVDNWKKEMKTSKVANKSPGFKKKTDRKFTATLYDTVDPTIELDKAKSFGPGLMGKSVPKGYSVSACTSISPNSAEPLSFDFGYEFKNKKTGDIMNFLWTSPRYPKTDADGETIANEVLEKNISDKPETEHARKDSYAWRLERKKSKNKEKITAFLEMTMYSIDVNLKEETGETIDPETKENDDFYYGNSDFE